VTATATPNPIPVGQSTTTISATNLSHTSLSKCKVSGFALPYTVTQTDDSYTYNVACTGNTGYNSCSADVTVTNTPPTTTTEPPLLSCNSFLTAKPSRIILGQDLNLIWSVGDNCDKDTCQATVTPETGGNWSGNPYNLPTTKLDTPALTYNTTSVKPTKADTYTYTLQCDGKDAETIAGVVNVDVRVIPLPFWREIIPNLQGFLRGLIK